MLAVPQEAVWLQQQQQQQQQQQLAPCRQYNQQQQQRRGGWYMGSMLCRLQETATQPAAAALPLVRLHAAWRHGESGNTF
jgi:hypothetical protein